MVPEMDREPVPLAGSVGPAGSTEPVPPARAPLSAEQVERYLRRIGCTCPTEPSLENLQALMTCHLRSVPYETVTLHRTGAVPSLALDDLFAKIVEGQGGGYCFEQNTLFQALLESLGYEVRPCFCRSTVTPGRVDPINHRGVLVTLGGGCYLADVGWGGPMAQGPLLLEPGIREVAGKRYAVERISDHWISIDRFSTKTDDQGDPLRVGVMELCLAEVRDEDFDALNREFSSPGSEFRDTAMANISREGGYASLTDLEFTVSEDGQKTVRKLDPEEIPGILKGYFGL